VALIYTGFSLTGFSFIGCGFASKSNPLNGC